MIRKHVLRSEAWVAVAYCGTARNSPCMNQDRSRMVTKFCVTATATTKSPESSAYNGQFLPVLLVSGFCPYNAADTIIAGWMPFFDRVPYIGLHIWKIDVKGPQIPKEASFRIGYDQRSSFCIIWRRIGLKHRYEKGTIN